MGSSGSSSSLRGRVAVVTGAGSGIGEATARQLSAHGAQLLIADIDPQSGQRVAQRIQADGGEALEFILDVSSESSWNNLLAIVEKTWKRWDILVNSAGVSLAKPIVDMTLEEWQRVHAVNLDGVFLGLRAALRFMSEHATDGVVINVASLSGIIPFPAASAYASSKAAVIQLSKVAARECAEARGSIRVYGVAPSGVKTPMWTAMPFFQEWARQGEDAAWKRVDPDNRFLEADEIAAAIAELVMNPEAHPNGEVWILDQRGSRGRTVALE
jgi:NAD(P)-dependent dehydrogenase (short-subunit alcohol dehydrogenase family)